MKTPVLLLGCMIALSGHAQDSKREFWKWRDANGVTHYSDRPVPGATRVVVAGVQRPATPPATAPARASATRPAPAETVTYRSLEIWQPENGESFFGADATVNIRMRSDPELAPGHNLRLYVDGRLQQGATNSLEYSLANLDRGAHSATAVISDARGNELIRSEPRVFHIRQPSIVPPANVGPGVRPPAPTPRRGG
ncbi:MAG: DUF4124 domain-containing protein [Steroidobacteraceae bacterium]|nr:DUF4124 domain-containing protein [Steroidobacteraceae bacterium]